MFSYIKGRIDILQPEVLILECHGIGYEIRIPTTVFEELSAQSQMAGQEIKIYTYLHVREDLLQLYGFLRMEDLEVFKLLLTVNGIGPKAALGILSVITPVDLRFAVLSEDKKTISKAPGIGAKTAGKLILELKDKFQLQDAFYHKLAHQKTEDDAAAENNNNQDAEKNERDQANIHALRQDAVEALAALGYSQTEALKAVNAVDMEQIHNVEELLRASLKQFSNM